MYGVRILKLNKGYKISNIDGVYIVCDQSGKAFDNIAVSQIGAFLWGLLEKNQVSKNDMLQSILEKFEISTVLALSEIDKFVRTMKENGIIEE